MYRAALLAIIATGGADTRPAGHCQLHVTLPTVKSPRRYDRTRSRLVARGIVVLAALMLTACGRGKPDLCAGAVRHVLELTSGASKDGKPATDAITATTSRCQQEGLSQPQADCILAAQGPEWSDQLRACPAFAARPASWVALGPSQKASKPSGPAEQPRRC
ncbi:MAG TPA: hypothetical protein VF516_32980 [Kofleriaceae bacterium]